MSDSQDKHRVVILGNVVFEKFSHVIRVTYNIGRRIVGMWIIISIALFPFITISDTNVV